MTDWLDRAFRREQRKRRAALRADQAHRRAHPLPPPDPRLIQGGGSFTGFGREADGAGYGGRFNDRTVNIGSFDAIRRKP